MKWRTRIFITAGLSALLALGMSVLPGLDTSSRSGVLENGQSNHAAQLTDKNLVDLLVQIPLQLRIRKVELNHSILSLDLNLPKNVQEEAVYRDLYTIAQTTIQKTANVNQVLVRIMDYAGAANGASAQLVLAMEADREHARNLNANVQEVSSILLEQQVKAHFHLTYTSRWQERYPL
ncbi:hypothetical protein [Paenibacillus eucommiae]|uniref:Uncharacterized protein n=1 Tax=Paenibacillus eucommiae TaxID=1355755 RepID=A0ABS4J4F1_9BACL|nr:hypothetical protein [Paenibacillus eucommiae]MBP1994718.1 hypothetical protein [Paenibacillus eucommiae]